MRQVADKQAAKVEQQIQQTDPQVVTSWLTECMVISTMKNTARD